MFATIYTLRSRVPIAFSQFARTCVQTYAAYQTTNGRPQLCRKSKRHCPSLPSFLLFHLLTHLLFHICWLPKKKRNLERQTAALQSDRVKDAPSKRLGIASVLRLCRFQQIFDFFWPDSLIINRAHAFRQYRISSTRLNIEHSEIHRDYKRAFSNSKGILTKI